MEKTLSDLKVTFSNASSYVKTIVGKLSNQQMLEFYGLYKQATEGPCTKCKPNWYEFTEKQKWEAWSALKNLKPEKAMSQYVELVDLIEPDWKLKFLDNKEKNEATNGWVHHSCMKNDEEILKDCNKTVFDWVKENNVEKVQSFGSSIAHDINTPDENGLSLLHWAADRGSLEIAKYIIENFNANVNAQDKDGQTPLHYAVFCEYDDVAKYLIEAGADINIRDNDGQTPYGT